MFDDSDYGDLHSETAEPSPFLSAGDTAWDAPPSEHCHSEPEAPSMASLREATSNGRPPDVGGRAYTS